MESFKTRQRMNVKDTVQEAVSIVGFNEKTARRHRYDFFMQQLRRRQDKEGTSNTVCITTRMRESVRGNAFRTTAQQECSCIHVLVHIHVCTLK